MALRDRSTPTSAQLTRLAEVTVADEERAVSVWDRRSKLPGLLDAVRNDDAGDASAPISDEER